MRSLSTGTTWTIALALGALVALIGAATGEVRPIYVIGAVLALPLARFAGDLAEQRARDHLEGRDD